MERDAKTRVGEQTGEGYPRSTDVRNMVYESQTIEIGHRGVRVTI